MTEVEIYTFRNTDSGFRATQFQSPAPEESTWSATPTNVCWTPFNECCALSAELGLEEDDDY